MSKLIKNSELIDNPWVIIAKESSLEQIQESESNALIVPAHLWLEHRSKLSESGKKIGVWLDSDETAAMLADDIPTLELIALNFPGFMDGRAYSTAAILRQQYHYKGELRAIGDVLRDQLFYMKRCGFDSFDVSDQVSEKDAFSAFKDFTTNYQSTVEEPAPLFNRR
jgi:uncharacterized protein (DUF934 family)